MHQERGAPPLSEEVEMSQSVIPVTAIGVVPRPRAESSPATRPAIGPPTVLSLHGTDELTGRAATWHVTPLAEDGAPGTYLVERVDGDIHNPAVWMQAQREATTVAESDVLALVARVMFSGPARTA
jgi:hypothetical protein